MYRTIIAVDVEKFGQRDPAHQRKIHKDLQPLVQEAIELCGLAWCDCHHEDRGDGVLVLAPPNAKSERLAECLPNELAGRLREYNHGAAGGARIRLRVVLHAGEVSYDQQGVASPAVVLAYRLLDAKPLRSALGFSHGVLALITSEEFFRHVIASHPGANPAIYQQVQVVIKEVNEPAWVCLPDNQGHQPINQLQDRSTASVKASSGGEFWSSKPAPPLPPKVVSPRRARRHVPDGWWITTGLLVSLISAWVLRSAGWYYLRAMIAGLLIGALCCVTATEVAGLTTRRRGSVGEKQAR
ncbi:MAG TPA: hypothetical protein VGP26_30390 [Actinophytocola sp.]|jgi:hypothetical protein|nr:hypothetical protein [Actinophytocola sp.]